MNQILTMTPIITLLGSAVVAGVFFAFSSFIMRALARLPAAQGIAAMQSINIVVINPLFLAVFIGTTIMSLMMLVIAVNDWQAASTAYYFAGGLLYVGGTFVVTGLGNVPLNHQLAIVDGNDSGAHEVWQHYLRRWTRLNSIRTVAAALAAFIMLLGLLN